MKPAQWKDIAELIGIAAIVASLIFVGFQLRQESEISVREGSSDFVNVSIEMANLFSTNRDVWLKGLNEEDLTDREQMTFNALVRVFYVYRVNQFMRQSLSVTMADTPQDIPRYVAFYLYQYPGLRQTYEQQLTKIQMMNEAIGAATESNFRQEVARMLEHFDANPPALPENDFVVF
jgi:hypothetical protein